MNNYWPTHTGPLKTLTELGNLQAGATPDWVLEPTYETDGASVGYKCRTYGSLGPQTVLDLAALIVEGWQVWILPRGRYARIGIYERPRK